MGRRPDRPVRRRVRQQEEARRGGRRSRVAEDVRRLRRRAGQAARVAAGRRAGDHARQQGPVRRDPPLGRDPGRLHAGAGHPRLDLPARTARRSTPTGNLKSLEKLKEWADKGYLGKADAYNSRNDADAGGRVRQGRGRAADRRQLERRDRQATGSATTRSSSTCRPARAADMVNIGSTSFPMHISAKTKQPDLAAAYLDWITGPAAGQELVDTQQVPAATDATAEPGDPLGQEVKDRLGPARRGRRPDAVPRLVVADDAADDGPVVPGDAGRPDLAAGRDLRACRSDWEEYHQELAGG